VKFTSRLGAAAREGFSFRTLPRSAGETLEPASADRTRAEFKDAVLTHFVETRADIARHGDDVASVRREVLRGLRDGPPPRKDRA